MPNSAVGGQSSHHEVPLDVEAALAILREYVAKERDELKGARSINGDKIHHSGDDQKLAVLAAYALTLLESGVTNIAANKRRRDMVLAREELKQELRAIDEKYRPRIELQAELRKIDTEYKLSAPDPDNINAKASEARRARIAEWRQGLAYKELQTELHAIDKKYGLDAPDSCSINARAHATIRARIAEWRQELECRYKEICSIIARVLVSIAGDLHEAKFPGYSIVTGVPENVRAGILMGTIEDIMSAARGIASDACNSLRRAAPSATLDGVLFAPTPLDDAAHRAEMPRTEYSRAQSAEERRQELERRHKKICASIARTLVSIAGDLYEIRHPGQDIVIGVPEDVRAAVLVGTLFYIASDAIGITWNACLSSRGADPSATLDDILFASARQTQVATR